MTALVLRRLGLALISLVLLSMLVFALAQLLPGDVCRQVLGGFATQEAVQQCRVENGLERSIVAQYLDWAGNMLRGDLGTSLANGESVGDLMRDPLLRSLELAVLAFVIMVPVSIFWGVVAGLRRGRLIDRAVSLGGASFTAIPEFVSGVILILLVAVILGWLPVSGQYPDDAGPLEKLEYLLLPAIVLALVLFGYVARMARAGVVEAMGADYYRTAMLKGLSTATVIRRHVLRNALLPTIAVIATQVGALIGGLVIVEKIFNIPGFGTFIVNAAQLKDFTTLEAGVMVVGVVYLMATLIADLLYALLNPRVRYGRSG